MTDLNDFLPPDSGWELISARDINDWGWIVWYGTNPDGYTRAFLLAPEPATLCLVALGCLVAFRRRR